MAVSSQDSWPTRTQPRTSAVSPAEWEPMPRYFQRTWVPRLGTSEADICRKLLCVCKLVELLNAFKLNNWFWFWVLVCNEKCHGNSAKNPCASQWPMAMKRRLSKSSSTCWSMSRLGSHGVSLGVCVMSLCTCLHYTHRDMVSQQLDSEWHLLVCGFVACLIYLEARIICCCVYVCLIVLIYIS